MENLATLRMGTLRASRSAVTDDIREAQIFSPSKVQERLHNPEALSAEELGLVGANDSAEPNLLSFFNGKPHAEGLKAYNAYLASKGRGPISAGQK